MVIWFCGLMLSVSAADTYSLADGSTLTGDIVTFSDAGIKFRLADDRYTEQMPWTQFSQEGLKQLAQNPKIRPLVEPFLELPPVEKVHQTENIKLQEVSRLDRPARQSLLAAMASSSVGLFLLVLIYAANLYAGFETAICRARPVAVVMGISAVLPFFGPAIFYLLPSLQQEAQTGAAPQAEGEAASAPATPANPAPLATPGAPATPAAVGTTVPAETFATQQTHATTEALDLSGIQVAAVSAAPQAPAVLQVFKRGQFTFNRRFMETKFAGFCTPARNEADQKLDFLLKLPQGYFEVQRILNVGLNDLQFEILQDGQPQVISAPFADIQEITLKSKPA
jgi:hypothetical protein